MPPSLGAPFGTAQSSTHPRTSKDVRERPHQHVGSRTDCEERGRAHACLSSSRPTAEFVNANPIRLVSIQHDYGIFGGDGGMYILDFVQTLRVPAIVTLHTVPDGVELAYFKPAWSSDV